MNPSDLLDENRILLDVVVESKKRAFEEIGLAIENTGGPPRSKVFKHLLERERLGSTMISEGVAIPHARIASLHVPLAAYLRTKEPLTYDTPETKVRHMFILLAPDEADGTHLKILSLMSRLLTDADFIAKAEACTKALTFRALVRDWENNNIVSEGYQATSG